MTDEDYLREFVSALDLSPVTRTSVEIAADVEQAISKANRTVEVDTIELDVCYGGWGDDELLDDVLRELTAGLAVRTRVVNPHGPAGGWPVVEFTGPAADVEVVARRYDGG